MVNGYYKLHDLQFDFVHDVWRLIGEESILAKCHIPCTDARKCSDYLLSTPATAMAEHNHSQDINVSKPMTTRSTPRSQTPSA